MIYERCHEGNRLRGLPFGIPMGTGGLGNTRNGLLGSTSPFRQSSCIVVLIMVGKAELR
jgi:hypothetical protein